MNIFLQAFLFSLKKGKKYKINTISWVIADVALYFSTFLLYILLGLSIENFGTYTKYEMLLYISTYTLVNNIYAIFFSEGVSAYSYRIMNGYFIYDLLIPRKSLFSIIIRNINFPPLLTTPVLFAVNIALIIENHISVNNFLLYILSLISGACSIMFLFVIIFTFQLIKVRTASLSGVILDLLSLSEKPDTVFPKKFKTFFTFIIPAFLMSALPLRVLLGKASITEVIWMYIAPIILYLVYRFAFMLGIKKYESEIE